MAHDRDRARRSGPCLRCYACGSRSGAADGDGLGALVSGLRLVRNLLALVEGAVALLVDARVMHEQILAAVVGRDETKALVGVEPFDSSSGHLCLHGYVP